MRHLVPALLLLAGTTTGCSPAPGAAAPEPEVTIPSPTGHHVAHPPHEPPHDRTTVRPDATCPEVSPPRLSVSDIVDDVVGTSSSCWVVTLDPGLRAQVRHTVDGGLTWTVHRAPERGLAGGSTARLRDLGDSHARLTVTWTNGPLTRVYRTDDGGRTWSTVSVRHRVV